MLLVKGFPAGSWPDWFFDLPRPKLFVAAAAAVSHIHLSRLCTSHGKVVMRSLNLNSTVNVVVSFGNDRINSVMSYVCDLVRSCLKPQLRSSGAYGQVQLWQMQRQRWIVQPAIVPTGNAPRRTMTAHTAITGRWPVTG